MNTIAVYNVVFTTMLSLTAITLTNAHPGGYYERNQVKRLVGIRKHYKWRVFIGLSDTIFGFIVDRVELSETIV